MYISIVLVGASFCHHGKRSVSFLHSAIFLPGKFEFNHSKLMYISIVLVGASFCQCKRSVSFLHSTGLNIFVTLSPSPQLDPGTPTGERPWLIPSDNSSIFARCSFYKKFFKISLNYFFKIFLLKLILLKILFIIMIGKRKEINNDRMMTLHSCHITIFVVSTELQPDYVNMRPLIPLAVCSASVTAQLVL